MGGLVVGVFEQDSSIIVEYGRLGGIAEITSVSIKHRKVPSLRSVEGVHGVLHGVVDAKRGRRHGHEEADGKSVVEVLSEDNVADFVDMNRSEVLLGSVHNGEDVALAACENVGELAQGHVGRDGEEVGLDDVFHRHEGEYGLVLLVGEEFACLCESSGIEPLAFKRLDGDVGDDRGDHERHEEVVAARDFGNEEDAREWSVRSEEHTSELQSR